MTARRLPVGGLIDRARPLAFTFDGRALSGFAGDTLASALLAEGVRIVGRSFKYHRPRGIFGAWVEEPNAIVDLLVGERHEANARATTTLLRAGLAARGVNARPDVARDVFAALDRAHRFLPAGFYYKTFFPNWHRYEPRIRAMAGLGRLRETADLRRFETRNSQCDVLIVGGGPAGLAAARVTAAAGLATILVDDRPSWGGTLASSVATIDDAPASVWAAMTAAHLAAQGVRLLPRTTVFGAYDHGMFGLLEERETAATGWAEERLWRVRARATVLATGAIERPLVFPDNDRPGVMSAAAVLDYLRRYGVLPGEQAIVATNNDSAYEVAAALAHAGAMVTLADVRPAAPGAARAAEALGVRVLPGSVVLRTHSGGGVCMADLGPADAVSTRAATQRLPADLIAVSGGWSPAVHLFSQAGGRLRWDAALAAFLPDAPCATLHLAGAVSGVSSLDGCLASGHEAGAAVARAFGRATTLKPARGPEADPETPISAYWRVPIRGARQWVDLQNDVTTADVALAARENYSSVEHLKRYTTLGMATDQGKTSNVVGLAVLAEETGRAIEAVGTTTFRPPYVPVSLGALAGMRHGALYAPWRRLPAHAQHVALGGEMREYGGWLRPACYRRAGESTQAATAREAGAVRTGLGLFDASSLGKIFVAGPDAAEFLNLLYYNDVASLKPGRIRYALLLRETGIVFDDGVVARLGPERYLLSPSSGHTAGVLAMLEAWRQTEYPAMRVAFHDATSAWATFALSGAEAARVLAPLTDLDLALPHMALAEARVLGVPGRIARVSFTGERSYEISVPAGYGPALWRRLLQSGATPYGIEALAILRAEKGYILVGTDTDGTTLPTDLGMAAPLRTKRVDFVGRRALATQDALRADRRQFVGLLPDDPAHVVPVGAHAIARDANGRRRSLGWITTACHSPALGRSIALGMIENGRALIEAGAEVELYHLGATSRARVVSPLFFDPSGERLRD
jgi:sarcosine oxidase subunit alpha